MECVSVYSEEATIPEGLNMAVVASTELAAGIVGASALLLGHSDGAWVSRDKHGTAHTVDEATVGPGCIGERSVTDNRSANFDSTTPVKGLNLGHALSGGATTSDETVVIPDEWAPFGGSIHSGYFSVRVLLPVITEATCLEGTAEYVKKSGEIATGFVPCESVEKYLATGEACGSGAPRVSDSAADCVICELSVFHGGMSEVTGASIKVRALCGSSFPVNPNWTYTALFRNTIEDEACEGPLTADEVSIEADGHHIGRNV